MKVKSLVAAMACSVMMTGCVGQFAAFEKVRDWNVDTGPNKWVDEGIYLVTAGLLPVYGIAFFADSLIFNSVEFWTGENPISKKKAIVGQRFEGEDGSVAYMKLNADNSIAVEVTSKEGAVNQFTLVKTDDTIAAYDAQGNLLNQVSKTQL